MFKNYLIIAWRNLWKHKLNSTINIVGLSMGLVCALVLFNFTGYELSFDSSFPLYKRTYRVVEKVIFPERVKHLNTTAYPLAEALRQEFSQLQYVTQTHGPVSGVVNIHAHSTPNLFEEDQILFVDSLYQEVFNIVWLDGNQTGAFSNPRSVVLTKSLAKKYFPEAIDHQRSILGKTLEITVPGEFEETFTITGLVADPPSNVTFRYGLLLPYIFYQSVDPYATGNWSGNYQGTTFVTLYPGQSASEIENLLPAFKRKYLSSEDNESKNYYLQPLSEVHNDETYGNAPGSYVIAKKYLYLVILLGLLVLITAGANYVSLSTAQVLNRTKEIGVRQAIGSSRVQLMMQFFFEALIVSVLAAVLALTAAPYILSELNKSLTVIELQLSMSSSMWWTAMVLVLGITLLAGLYPGIVASKIKMNNLMGSGLLPSSGIKRNVPIRKSLLVLQFTICQILVAATLIVAWQMNYLGNLELGFEKDEIITVPIPEFDQTRLEAFKFRLKQHADIGQVSLASGVPTSHDLRLGTTFRLSHAPEPQKLPAEMKVVDDDYITTYNLRLIAGEGVTSMKEDGQFTGFVVNETLVNTLGLSAEEAIGEQVVINEGQAPIIGVVADFHNSSLKEEISPCLIFNWYPDFLWEAGIKINSGNTRAALDHIKQIWQEFFPQSMYRFQFLREYLNGIYALEQLLLLFVRGATILAIILGCMGLYGLVAFSAAQRTKEIGIRKVLGANATDILAIFSSEYVKMLVLSFAMSTPISWYLLNNWLGGFAYRIEIGLGVFLLTFFMTLLVAIGAISTRLWKVIRINPVDSLKYE